MIKEDMLLDVDPKSSEQSVEPGATDPLADTSGLLSQEVPSGVDRRNFLMRSAVGGAAAVMTGRSVSRTGENSEGPRNAAAADGAFDRDTATYRKRAAAASFQRPERRQKGPGARADDRGRVLQGRAGPIKLAHDRSNAHHLRLLPASRQTPG